MRESWPPARPCEHGNVSLIGGSKRHWSKYNVVQILQICVVLLDFKSVCVIGEHVFPFEYVLKDIFFYSMEGFQRCSIHYSSSKRSRPKVESTIAKRLSVEPFVPVHVTSRFKCGSSTYGCRICAKISVVLPIRRNNNEQRKGELKSAHISHRQKTFRKTSASGFDG